MQQLLEAETPVVTIVGKTWLLHVTEVLRATPDENLAMIADTIKFFKDHRKIVIYDAEHSFDGYKNEAEYAVATWQAAEKAGADCIVLCDTNGGCMPDDIARITTLAKSKLNTRIGIHTHNDIGLDLPDTAADRSALLVVEYVGLEIIPKRFDPLRAGAEQRRKQGFPLRRRHR